MSKVFNRKSLTGQSFSKMKMPANIVKREYFSCISYVRYTTFFQLCVCGCDHFLAGCGWVWPFSGWLWVGVGRRDLFWLGVGECGWVCITFVWLVVGDYGWLWPFFWWVCVGLDGLTFFGWVWVSATFLWLVVCCNLFLAGCGRVLVSVTFLWLGVG